MPYTGLLAALTAQEWAGLGLSCQVERWRGGEAEGDASGVRFPRAHLDEVAAELNDRPRKVLGWDIPAERLATLIGPGHGIFRRLTEPTSLAIG
ncbi:hypothetical protein L1080_035635 [Rhodococcus sp. MSC1_016]|jgi:hypothetical protein|uniref:hypothetical protein n=1 Tax=Rhodococcus sp. MSC1_016 TaxID=2909266 RepID=UPI00202FF4B1|nr:hypothetical protein [Rhodococcus sp. MSC1_016]